MAASSPRINRELYSPIKNFMSTAHADTRSYLRSKLLSSPVAHAAIYPYAAEKLPPEVFSETNLSNTLTKLVN